MIISRSASPSHGFIILNRLGLTNQIEPITKDLEFQLQDPFLLYRNKTAIYGIWFYDKDECARIGQMMNSFVQVAIESHTAKAALRNRRASESDSMHDIMSGTTRQVNILQMLSKAQDEYDKAKKKPDPKPFIDNPNASATKSSDLIRPRPVKAMAEDSGGDTNQNSRPQSGTLTLETLFRNASLQQKVKSHTSNVETSKPPHSFQRSVSMTESQSLNIDSKGSQDVPALLKHIMSSGSMVEDIEREQRGEISPSEKDKKLSNGGSYKLMSKSKSKDRDLGVVSEPSRFPESGAESRTKSVTQDLTEKFGDALSLNRLNNSAIRKSSPSEFINRQSDSGLSGLGSVIIRASPSENIFRQSDSSLPGIGRVGSAELLTPADLEMSTSSASSSEKGSLTSTKQLSAAAASLNADVLLSPMAFAGIFSKSPVTDETGRLNRSNDSGSSQEGSTCLPVAALTKEQLQQAIIHLMKTDPSFINTLHEAYLSSLKELSKS